MVPKSCFPFPSSRSYQVVFTEILAGRVWNLVLIHRLRKLHRGLRRGGQVFMVQPLRGFCLECWILNLNSTISIHQFDNSTATLGSASSTAADRYVSFYHFIVFCLERWILNLNSTIQQFDNLTIRRFNNSSIQQSQFDNSTATLGSASSTGGYS